MGLVGALDGRVGQQPQDVGETVQLLFHVLREPLVLLIPGGGRWREGE